MSLMLLEMNGTRPARRGILAMQWRCGRGETKRDAHEYIHCLILSYLLRPLSQGTMRFARESGSTALAHEFNGV